MRSKKRSAYSRQTRRYPLGLGERSSLLTSPGPLLVVSVPLPLSVHHRARNRIYNYPQPLPLRRRTRTLRRVLKIKKREPYVMTKVRIRLPKKLPTPRQSYVSFQMRQGKAHMSVHSKVATQRVIEKGEENRARKKERKPGHRRAHYNQAESPGSHKFGAMAEALRRGLGTARIADAALAARAIRKGKRK